MNPSIYERWPFAKPHARTPLQTEQWMNHCYLDGPAQEMFISAPHWRILSGGPGSGKTAARLALEQMLRDQALLVNYSLDRWPGGIHVPVKGGNHLVQIMELAGWKIRDYITAHPQLVYRLSSLQKEFIRWLLERQGGARAFNRWIDGLPPTEAATFSGIQYDEVYGTATNPQDTQGQVDELGGLVRRLELDQVLVTVDLNQTEAAANLGQLEALFEWLDLFHHPGLALAATLPQSIVIEAGLIEKAKGRVEPIYLHWTKKQVQEIGIRHARCALRNHDLQWTDLVSDKALEPLENLLMQEFGTPTPHGWVALAGALIALNAQGEALPFETGSAGIAMLKPALYAQGFPLLIDPLQGGVWRGPTYINLSPKRYRFLEALYKRNGRPRATDSDLLVVAKTKGNINTLAKRLREDIEPDVENPIYVLNRGGYFLNNCDGIYGDRRMTGI